MANMVRQAIPGAAVLADRELTILGAPISQAAAEVTMNDKKEELERMVKRLQTLDPHSAFFLLKNSLWLPKLQYVLRAAPIYHQPELLQSLDRILKSAVSLLSNVDFDEESWRQAVLPTRYGGLGLRRTEDVALPSYAASVHSCRSLVTVMVPEELRDNVARVCAAVTEDWQKLTGASEPPELDLRSKQRAWDDILSEKQWKAVLSEANQFARARLLNAATQESGAWLHAIPAASLGTMLDKETLRIAIAMRIGADVCIPHQCRCGSPADSKGHHALTCRFSAGRHPRHTALNEVTRRALQSAGIPSILEPTGLDCGDGKRPDGMTIFPYAHGKSLLWDATCVNTYAETNIALSATSWGAAAGEAEAKKRRKYAGLRQGFQFEPVAFETAGACGPTTRAFIKELGARLAASSGDRREAAWLWQRFAIAVIRGNAVSVLSTTTPKSGPTSQQQQQPLSERQQREQLQQMQQISKAAPPRQQQQPLQQILQRPGTYQQAEDNSSPESLPKTMQGKHDSENSESDLHILDLETSTDRDQPMSPRSKDPLLEFRQMYLQICSEIRSSEGLDDRNPMSDPDLAYYLAGKRPDKSELSDQQLRGRELRGQTNHSSTDKSRDRSPRHHGWHERRLRRRAACAEPREDRISHAEDGEERVAARLAPVSTARRRPPDSRGSTTENSIRRPAAAQCRQMRI